jgi:uncharacterized damage-inducible protein DinB
MAEAYRPIVAAALSWEQAHVSFERAVAGLPAELRGRRPADYPHSVWELVEHIRIAQLDLVEYMEGPDHEVLTWPEGYWPEHAAPPTQGAWDESVAAVLRDRDRLAAIATREELDLTAAIPWGEGRTYLRTVLLAVDHTAYHVGQIVAVRRLLGVWPPG